MHAGLVQLLRIDLLNPPVYVISERFVVLLLADKPLRLHILKHFFPALVIILWMDNRIVAARVFGNARDYGRLRQCKLGHILAKIPPGCRLHAERILAEIDRI